MKIKQEHYESIKAIITKFDKDSVEKGENSINEHAVEYRDVYKFSPKRFRWDVLFAATRHCNIHISHSDNEADLPLYDYANDDHIDTALRKVMSELAAPEWASEK